MISIFFKTLTQLLIFKNYTLF